MDTDELSTALRAATVAIDTPPGFTERVQRGARRRVVWRRYRVCAVVLVVLAIGGGLATLSAHLKPEVSSTHQTDSPKSGNLPSDDPRLHEATKGDLAQDQPLHDEAVAVWQHSSHLPLGVASGSYVLSPVGQVNEYWAGTTRVGPVAVMVQAYGARSMDSGRPTDVVEIGLVANDAKTGQLTLEGSDTVGDTHHNSDTFAFGQDNTMMLTMAESGLHVYSAAPTVATTGKVSRQWLELPYVDGVAVVDLRTAQGNGRTVVELPRRPDAAHPYLAASIPPGNSPYQPRSSDEWTGPADPRLTWPLETTVCVPPEAINPTNQPAWSTVFDDALHNGGYSDPYVRTPVTHGTTDVPATSESYWHIGCWLADGNLLILGEELVGGVGRLYAVTADRDGNVVSVGYGGPIAPAALLPVTYRLPDGSGWLVAAYGSQLSSSGLDDSDVLPVPPGPTSVTVTPRGGQSQPVELTG